MSYVNLPDAGERWCCMCGLIEPDGDETCPVSDEQMPGSDGLRHLIAYGFHRRALDIYYRDAPYREAARDRT